MVEPEKRDAQPYCEAEGINFAGVWEHADLVATAAVTTNDVGAVLRTFGVEAARATIVHEVIKVFEVYGIGVDVRHLALIADFMTHQVWRAAAQNPNNPQTLSQIRCKFPLVCTAMANGGAMCIISVFTPTFQDARGQQALRV